MTPSGPRAVDLDASEIELRNAAGVADVVEGIRIEHQQVGALAWRQRAPIGEPDEPGGRIVSSLFPLLLLTWARSRARLSIHFCEDGVTVAARKRADNALSRVTSSYRT